jgi:flavin-dependent dehydrogenase
VGAPVQIAGAGPAGLAAAITLAHAGRSVIVHEAQREVGYRFRRDLQGLENWTAPQDVLAELQALGLSTAFDKLPCRRGTVYDPRGRARIVQSDAPIFYLIERGPGTGTLDTALLEQARALGVVIRFNSRLERLEVPAVLAAGPKVPDAIAVGYHFDTAMADGVWVICDDALAPQGYAYLLVMHGKGTVKTCMFSSFKNERVYVERTLEAFRRLVGLEMRNARRHGGIANFRIPPSARAGARPMAGEQAGFQDALWGFGMRLAIRSGVLAARSLIEGEDYDALWQRELRPWIATSIVNRAIYSRLGDRGYPWFLRWAACGDAREFLRRQYRPSSLKRLLEPWVLNGRENAQAQHHDPAAQRELHASLVVQVPVRDAIAHRARGGRDQDDDQRQNEDDVVKHEIGVAPERGGLQRKQAENAEVDRAAAGHRA